MIGNQEQIKDKRVEMAKKLESSILKYSIIANAVWQSRDKRQLNNINNIQSQLVTYSTAKLFRTRYVARGRDYIVDSKQQIYSDLTDTWVRSSQLMSDLAHANRFKYLLILQPNQYVSGSKPMTEEEKKKKSHSLMTTHIDKMRLTAIHT